MSKYNDYGEFLEAVLNEADYKCRRRACQNLVNFSHLCSANGKFIRIMIKIIEMVRPAFKTTPLKIYEVGRKYKSRLDDHINECSYIDDLIDEAANDLIY